MERVVPPAPTLGTIAPRTPGRPRSTVKDDTGLPRPDPHETTHSMTFAHAALPIRATRERRLPADGPRRFAAMVALAFAVTTVGLLLAPREANAWSSGEYSSTSERALVTLTNQSRAAAGLKALKVDSTLTVVARSRSKDMIVRNYFSHNIPPSGKMVFSILDSKHYCYAVAGENIGWNDYPDDSATKTIHQMFMKSADHRANILGKRWDVIGVGAYKGSNGKKMWTVLFADKCGSSGGTAPKPKPKPTSNPVTKPKPTAKPTARPTARPTAVPTPIATPSAEPTDPFGLGLGPRATASDSADPGDGPPDGTTATDTVGSLRVTDPPTPPGLLESIVGDVTGFFFGG